MSSPARRELEDFVAGRSAVMRVVAAVMEAYYREEGGAARAALRPVVDVIERAAPGVVELAAAGDAPGFRVRLAERAFPERCTEELREAAGAALRAWVPDAEAAPGAPPVPGLLRRVLQALRRVFSA